MVQDPKMKHWLRYLGIRGGLAINEVWATQIILKVFGDVDVHLTLVLFSGHSNPDVPPWEWRSYSTVKARSLMSTMLVSAMPIMSTMSNIWHHAYSPPFPTRSTVRVHHIPHILRVHQGFFIGLTEIKYNNLYMKIYIHKVRSIIDGFPE